MRWAANSRLSFRGFLVACVVLCGAQVAVGQKGDKNDDSDSGYRPAPSANVEGDVQALPIDAPPGSDVVVVAIDRTVELGLAAFVRRAVEDNPDAAAIILEVNTLGGRVDAAIQIRDAIEKLFDVKVLSVRTQIVRGKIKRRGQFAGKRSNWKKAIVSSCQIHSSLDEAIESVLDAVSTSLGIFIWVVLLRCGLTDKRSEMYMAFYYIFETKR